MSTKVNSFIVILKDDVSQEDAERVKELFGLIAGVLTVSAVASDFTTVIAEERAKRKLLESILELTK